MNSSPLRATISAAYLEDENAVAARIIAKARLTPEERAATEKLARDLVVRIRETRGEQTGVDALMQEYALSTQEGVVLMCLAESLLRVPDAATADKLIKDKIGSADWDKHKGQSDSMFVNASTWALMLTGRVVKLNTTAGWDFEGILRRLVSRTGEPVIRQAVTYAMRILGQQFVLGRSIEEAMKNAKPWLAKGYRFSFDMLGEAAYTAHDARRYYDSYREALRAIAKAALDDGKSVFERPSISVKLSALHPRYEWVKRDRVLDELLPQLCGLAAEAREANIGITLDAEEAERLDIMLDIFEAMGNDPRQKNWNGLGMVVQAYQKRALPVIAWLGNLAHRQKRRIPVRLVKGAYWDSEIKRAQEMGLSDYPTFTRKLATDASYLAGARALLAEGDAIFPQFATHNAHTLAAIQTFSKGHTDFECQRLHGMGESLHALYREKNLGGGSRIYAPVGTHEDLLAYLVRRLLENGANASFVNRLADDEAPIDDIVADPVEQLAAAQPYRNPRIPLPADILPDRKNSSGFFWSDPVISEPLIEEMKELADLSHMSAPIVGGEFRFHGADRAVVALNSPSNRNDMVGLTVDATDSDVKDALTKAYNVRVEWNALGGNKRAEILERAAEFYEKSQALLMMLAVREAGKTNPNALGEVREAVDFLRYYAGQARKLFEGAIRMPGPTGETNDLTLHGKGVFCCISPWNFPLAIFTGQVAGALAAGCPVLAKPAEQTPLIAAAAVKLLHRAGVPVDVLHLLPGDGPRIGNALFADPRLAGVAFTGSTEAANAINRALASRQGSIATLIAETGGQNAMIVDSTALPEQVCRDVLASAFDSAGQRCSACRVLFLQDDVADKMLDLILGAMDELKLGDPFDLATDIGPVIDEEARKNLQAHADKMAKETRLLKKLPVPPELSSGVFFPPHVFEISTIEQLKREVFGPVLHVVRWSADELGKVCDAINATGYGLTLGIHSRIDETAQFIRDRVHAGNVYVNRNQIGAVVGVQPFGGEGLSGTGPKAGGPNYLVRFALERTYTVNTTAAGGNASLLAGGGDDGI